MSVVLLPNAGTTMRSNACRGTATLIDTVPVGLMKMCSSGTNFTSNSGSTTMMQSHSVDLNRCMP
eukprot:8473588-Lingulodinium_polyedra.AAC.1